MLPRFFRFFSGFFPPAKNPCRQKSLNGEAAGAGVELLIDLAGRSLKIGKRNVAVAISKLGYIHIQSIEHPVPFRATPNRTVIVTLQPWLLSKLAIVAAAFSIADLSPERTIVVAEFAKRECWISTGYMPAIRRIAALVSDPGDTDISSLAEAHERSVIDSPLIN
jgi:hypothetical protein